jgi:hypothetical protein
MHSFGGRTITHATEFHRRGLIVDLHRANAFICRLLFLFLIGLSMIRAVRFHSSESRPAKSGRQPPCLVGLFVRRCHVTDRRVL